MLELTERGRRTLGLADTPSGRGGGAIHRYWKARLAEHLRTCGYSVTEEYPIGGGKTIDLVAMRDGRRIAFEIETGSSASAANAQKCLDAGSEEVFVVATSARLRSELARKLESYAKTSVMTGSEATEHLAER